MDAQKLRVSPFARVCHNGEACLLAAHVTAHLLYLHAVLIVKHAPGEVSQPSANSMICLQICRYAH